MHHRSQSPPHISLLQIRIQFQPLVLVAALVVSYGGGSGAEDDLIPHDAPDHKFDTAVLRDLLLRHDHGPLESLELAVQQMVPDR